MEEGDTGIHIKVVSILDKKQNSSSLASLDMQSVNSLELQIMQVEEPAGASGIRWLLCGRLKQTS